MAFKINGKVVPAPARFKYSLNSIEGDAQRLANGQMYITRVRNEIKKISVVWENLTKAEAKSLIAELDTTVFFTVEHELLFGEKSQYYHGEITVEPLGSVYRVSTDLIEK